MMISRFASVLQVRSRLRTVNPQILNRKEACRMCDNSRFAADLAALRFTYAVAALASGKYNTLRRRRRLVRLPMSNSERGFCNRG